MKERFKRKLIQNKESGNHILITVGGIGKSIFPYLGNLANQITKQSLFYLDKILSNADSPKREPNKHKGTNNKNKQDFENVDIYIANYKLDVFFHTTRIIARIYPPEENDGPMQCNFYCATVDEIKIEPTTAKGNRLEKSQKPELRPREDSINSLYSLNDSKSRDVQKS